MLQLFVNWNPHKGNVSRCNSESGANTAVSDYCGPNKCGATKKLCGIGGMKNDK